MRLDIKAFATASAVAGMLLYAFGALLDRFSSWGGAEVISVIFRVDVVQVAEPFTFGMLLFGLATCGLGFGALGACMAFAYNRLTRPASAPSTAPVVRPVG